MTKRIWVLVVLGALLKFALADTSLVTISGANFVDSKTGSALQLRGATYTRVSANGTKHVLFVPGSYDTQIAGQVLATMRVDGYNVVRVFIDPILVGGADGQRTLNAAYLDNFITFLNLAKFRGLYVQVALPAAPWSYTGAFPQGGECGGSMNQFAIPPIGVAAKKAYVTDFISYLKAAHAPTEQILAYSIENEFAFRRDCEPLVAAPRYECGDAEPIWTRTNAGVFNLNSRCGQQALMDANMVRYVDEVSAAIKSVDRSALVTMGFFSPYLALQSNLALRPHLAIRSKGLDFISLHFNLAPSGARRPQGLADSSIFVNPALDRQVESIFEGDTSSKPILMEEFYMKSHPGASLQEAHMAALMARDAQIQLCRLPEGRRITNSLFWTWDTKEPDSQGQIFWALTDNESEINNYISPRVRPDPCQVR